MPVGGPKVSIEQRLSLQNHACTLFTGRFTLAQARKDLDRKIMRYIRSCNRKATPAKWSFRDASNRIKTAWESNETVQ